MLINAAYFAQVYSITGTKSGRKVARDDIRGKSPRPIHQSDIRQNQQIIKFVLKRENTWRKRTIESSMIRAKATERYNRKLT